MRFPTMTSPSRDRLRPPRGRSSRDDARAHRVATAGPALSRSLENASLRTGGARPWTSHRSQPLHSDLLAKVSDQRSRRQRTPWRSPPPRRSGPRPAAGADAPAPNRAGRAIGAQLAAQPFAGLPYRAGHSRQAWCAGPDPLQQSAGREGDIELPAVDPRVVRAARAGRKRGRAVAARPAGLLVVGLRRGWQRPMNDETNVRLVDAHAERAGRDDHSDLVVRGSVERRGAAAGA